MQVRLRMWSAFVFVLFAAITSAGPLTAVRAQVSQSPTEVSALLEAEDRRFRAQVNHDLAALQETIAEEASFSHNSGYHQSKPQFLEAIITNRLVYQSIKPHDRVGVVSCDLGVVRGLVSLDLGGRIAENSYLAVYIKRDNRWQLLDWQTGAAAPSQTPAKE